MIEPSGSAVRRGQECARAAGAANGSHVRNGFPRNGVVGTDALWRVRRRLLKPKLGGALLAALGVGDASGGRERLPSTPLPIITGPCAVIAW